MKVNRRTARIFNYTVILITILIGSWIGSLVGQAGFDMIDDPLRNDWLKYKLGIPLAGAALTGLVGIIFGDILERHIKYNP